jgi:hypothetical protein
VLTLFDENQLKIIGKIAEVLIPGDKLYGLPGAHELVSHSWKSNTDFQEKATCFVEEFERFLGHKCRLTDVNEEKVLDFLRKNHSKTLDFLNLILEFYYTNPTVLNLYPDFSGVTYPGTRKMPANNFDLLEPVVAARQGLDN